MKRVRHDHRAAIGISVGQAGGLGVQIALLREVIKAVTWLRLIFRSVVAHPVAVI